MYFLHWLEMLFYQLPTSTIHFLAFYSVSFCTIHHPILFIRCISISCKSSSLHNASISNFSWLITDFRLNFKSSCKIPKTLYWVFIWSDISSTYEFGSNGNLHGTDALNLEIRYITAFIWILATASQLSFIIFFL